MNEVCKANHGLECIKCTPGPCDNRHELDIPMPQVKEPKKSIGEFTISVDKTDLDEALEKAKELHGVLKGIDGLVGRITRDIEKINAYALGKRI